MQQLSRQSRAGGTLTSSLYVTVRVFRVQCGAVVLSIAASRYRLFAGAWLQTQNYYVSGGDILDCSRKYKLMNACFLDHSPLHKVRIRLNCAYIGHTEKLPYEGT